MSDSPNVETRLEAMERRLAEIQQELAPDVPPSSVPEPAPAPDPAASPAAAVEVSAGPFPSMDALREFERAIAALPGVREVAVRGYESGNRAIIEVQLAPETS
jgi:hypothetical protein